MLVINVTDRPIFVQRENDVHMIVSEVNPKKRGTLKLVKTPFRRVPFDDNRTYMVAIHDIRQKPGPRDTFS